MARSGAGITALMLLAAVITIWSLPVPAHADGDPASDVLLGQDVFLPYSAISQSVERQLYAVTAAARQAGFPLKIALIGAKTDLGVLPTLFAHPEKYARYLTYEVAGVVNGPVLVVMPDGFGLAAQGKALSTATLSRVPIGHGTDGLGLAAVAATRRLAAAAGHPLPASATSSASPLGAGPPTVRHATIAILILAALAAAAMGGAFVARSRRRLRAP